MSYPKRLIEVDLPIRRISEHAELILPFRKLYFLRMIFILLLTCFQATVYFASD